MEFYKPKKSKKIRFLPTFSTNSNITYTIAPMKELVVIGIENKQWLLNKLKAKNDFDYSLLFNFQYFLLYDNLSYRPIQDFELLYSKYKVVNIEYIQNKLKHRRLDKIKEILNANL